MSKFTETELAFIQAHHIGRLATVSRRGEPQNKPVGFRYNPELDTIDIGGPENGKSQKFHNVALNGLASFVIDDMTNEGGGGVEIRAKAEALPTGGKTVHPRFSPEMIRLTPTRVITWDLANRLPRAARNVD